MATASQTAEQNPKVEDIKNFYAFKLTDIDGKPLAFSKFEGKVVLVVNTASQCGLTPQYDALQKIYDANKSSGFAILGVPSNDFGQQEPGTEKDIKKFCSDNFKVTFPMTTKTTVLGENKHKLYEWLTFNTDKKEIEWNFAKFLINRKGQVIKRFPSRMKPDNADITVAIKEAISQK